MGTKLKHKRVHFAVGRTENGVDPVDSTVKLEQV